MSKNTKRTAGKPRLPAETDTEVRLWRALERHPHSTAKHLAEVAGVGQSTAAKALRRWATAGYVTRETKGDGSPHGSRSPNRWAVTTSEGQAADRQRLGRGELRAAVAAYLAVPERSGQSYTPGQIARTLGRSAGAVTNALHRLTVDGAVTQTGDRPRRFALAHLPAHQSTETTAARTTSPKSKKSSR